MRPFAIGVGVSYPTLAVSVSPTSVGGSQSGNSGSVTSGSVTASATGGSGSVTWQWTRTGGDAGIAIDHATLASTTFSRGFGSPGSASATFIASATDTVTGQTLSTNAVTVNLTLNAPIVLSVSVTSTSGSASVGSSCVVGPITVSTSGFQAGARQFSWSSSAGTITQVGSRDSGVLGGDTNAITVTIPYGGAGSQNFTASCTVQDIGNGGSASGSASELAVWH